MHTPSIRLQHLGSASIAGALLVTTAHCSDLHNYHSNDISEPIIVSFATDATARADGEVNESSQPSGSYNHPVRLSDNYIFNVDSQAGGSVQSTGRAEINASAHLERTTVSDDYIKWSIECDETIELYGGTPSNPVSTSVDVSSTLWYTVDLLEAQEIVFWVTSRSYNFRFDGPESPVTLTGNIAAWDGSEGTISGPPTFHSVSDGVSYSSDEMTHICRIWLPAGRWRLQTSFNGTHTRESVTSDLVEEHINFFWYDAMLQPRNPSYLTPDNVAYFEQDRGMLTATTTSGEKSDSNTVYEYNEMVNAQLGSDYMIAPWAASNVSAIQHPLHWDDEGFYQTLDAQAELAADTAHPFETSSIQTQVQSTPKLDVKVGTDQRIEISFSSEVMEEAWADHKYDVIVTNYGFEGLPTGETEPISVSRDGRRFQFWLSRYGNIVIEPRIQLEHSLTAQGWMEESKPHEMITMRVKFFTRSDLNGDGLVNGSDLATLLAKWGVDSFEADLNGDGVVNGEDLARMLSDWG